MVRAGASGRPLSRCVGVDQLAPGRLRGCGWAAQQ